MAVRRAAGLDVWDESGGERGFWRSFVGAIWERLDGGPFPEPMLEELIRHFQHRGSWRVYPEVPGTLASLRRLGYRLFVVSNWDSSLPALLAALDLAPWFDGLVVSAEVGKAKPAPEIFAAALEAAGVPAHAALHVGDSRVEDYDGARKAGIPALLLDRAGRGPDGVASIRSLDELLPFLEGAA